MLKPTQRQTKLLCLSELTTKLISDRNGISRLSNDKHGYTLNQINSSTGKFCFQFELYNEIILSYTAVP